MRGMWVATWKLGNHLSIRLQTKGKQEKPVSRWPVAGPSGYRLLAISPAPKVRTAVHITVLSLDELHTDSLNVYFNISLLKYTESAN